MSTTLLYQSFGIRGYQQTGIEFIGGVTRFHVQPTEKSICCASCGSRNVIVPRVQCRDCGGLRQIKVDFADQRRSYTEDWAKYALQVTRSMTVNLVQPGRLSTDGSQLGINQHAVNPKPIWRFPATRQR